MATSAFSTTVDVMLALVAAAGLAVGWYFYVRYPWERVNRESRIPAEPGTVELTRLGVSAGFFAFVPIAVGSWAYYVGTMVELRSAAGVETAPPTLAERVAMALPGEVVAAGGFLAAVVAFVAPLVLVVQDVVSALVGRRGA